MPNRNEDQRTTCVAATSDAQGTVYALVVLTDSESYYSMIYRVADFDAADDPVYEVPAWLTSLWLSPDGHLYAVDSIGSLHTNESGHWNVIDLGCPHGLTWIRGVAGAGIFACGNVGAIVHMTEGKWRLLSIETNNNLYGLDGSGANDRYAVGQNGTVLHFDSDAWRQLPSPTNYDLHAVCCATAEQVYLCGEGGMLFEGNKFGWNRVEGIDFDIYALALFNGLLYVGAGEHGLFSYNGKDIKMVKDNIIAYSLQSSHGYLCAAGNDEAARYDGMSWEARGWT